MIRRPRRTTTALLVAVVLLAAAVVIAVSCVQALLGQVPLLPFADLATAGARTTGDSPVVIAVAAVVGLIGLWLLLVAVTPGNATVLPLDDGGSGIDTGITCRSLDRALTDAAAGIDGVGSTTVRSRRRRVRVDARAAFGDTAQLTDRIRERLTERVTEIGPTTAPRIAVRVARPRNR